MMYYALSANVDTKYKAFSGDAWAEAGKVTLLGLGMIFAVLALLWLVLSVFKLLFVKNNAKKPAQNIEKAPAAEEAPAPAAATTDDDALIAVITAAITAYRSSEEGMDSTDANGFRVVSFKRAGKSRSWNSNK